MCGLHLFIGYGGVSVARVYSPAPMRRMPLRWPSPPNPSQLSCSERALIIATASRHRLRGGGLLGQKSGRVHRAPAFGRPCADTGGPQVTSATWPLRGRKMRGYEVEEVHWSGSLRQIPVEAANHGGMIAVIASLGPTGGALLLKADIIRICHADPAMHLHGSDTASFAGLRGAGLLRATTQCWHPLALWSEPPALGDGVACHPRIRTRCASDVASLKVCDGRSKLLVALSD